MPDVREATRNLLADSPALEEPLHDLLSVDADGPFEFDDVPLDSGQFGEVVASGIVEKTGDGYRVADRTAVQRALDGERAEQTAGADSPTSIGESIPVSDGFGTADDTIAVRSVDYRSAAALAAALLFVALARVVPMWSSVYRNGDIVLAGNDSYFYRYWGEELLAGSLSALDPTALGDLPGQVPTHDTITIVSVWWTSALLGGDARAVGQVLAWYPVLAAVLTAVGCYLLAVWLTDDRRIGLASVVLLAVTPTHAMRTALGFGDHHAADYVWLTMVALAVVLLARERLEVPWDGANGEDDRDDSLVPVLSARALSAVVLLGVAITGQTHAWRAGVLLLVPAGLALVAQVPIDVENDRSPVAARGPLLIGLALGAFLAGLLHVVYGWAPVFRAIAPTLLFAGAVAVVLIGEAAVRYGLSARQTAGATVATGAVGAVTAVAALPSIASALEKGINYFTRTGQSGIAETYSIFSGEVGSIIGPIYLFGFVLFLAVPYLVWGVWYGRRADRPDWLAAGVFGWYFLLLAVVQSRFAGQLSLFTAVFGGLGFVHLVAVVDAAERPVILGGDERPGRESTDTDGWRPSLPDRRTTGTLVLLFLLVASFGMIQTGVKQSQIAVDGDTYETASWIADYADERGQTYPENYVFSPWSTNRVYNYFVNGESRRYVYAQDNYEEFLSSSAPDVPARTYEQLDDHGTGYVVTTDVSGTPPASSIHARLQQNLGSRAEEISGLGRFRFLHRAGEMSPTVFEFVEGARMTGTATPNETYTIQRPVNASGESFVYERQVETNRYGDYGIVVPYSGTYEIGDLNRNVTDSNVERGEIAGSYRLHMPFDEGAGNRTASAISQDEGEIQSAEWSDGVVESGLSFDDNDDQVAVDDYQLSSGDDSLTLSFWVKGDLTATDSDYPTVVRTRSQDTGAGYGMWVSGGNLGLRVFDSEGESVKHFGIGKTDYGDWTHIVGVYDREESMIRLYRNGSLVGSSQVSNVGSVNGSAILNVGSRGGSNHASMRLDDLRVYHRAFSTAEVRTLMNRTE